MDFAHTLFDEQFEWVDDNRDRQDLITPERASLTAKTTTWKAAPETVAALHER
jgi:hypothetical protein